MSKDPIKENSSGFPNPATDGKDMGLDLNKLVVKHPASTFYMRVEGEEYADQGIHTGDIVVIDRSLEARPGDTILTTHEGNLIIAQLSKETGTAEEIDSWGVVTFVVSSRSQY